MKKVYLCGHTGSINRGCEAIVRSTDMILKHIGINEVAALSFDTAYDAFVGLDKEVKIYPYHKFTFAERAYAVVFRRFFHNKLIDGKILYKDLFKAADNDTVIFNVGGDIYCCSHKPYLSYALNKTASQKGIPVVFWGCSVDDKLHNDEEMQADINRYSYIVARETSTADNIDMYLSDKTTLKTACDPAFMLEPKQTALPENFISGNTVGINLSPLVFADYRNDNDMMYQNIRSLIDYIVENTDMNICLVPHVYNIENNVEDYKVLKRIYVWYAETDRIGIVDKELSCTELKYIISKCRFFIGARTHSVIAAYSSAVPALALSYSLKSIGIARDLFSGEEGFTLNWKAIEGSDEIKNMFIKTLIKKEDLIRKRYKEILPSYKQTIVDTVKEIFKELS